MTLASLTDYPFTAVAGQDNFKLALILAAINPLLGGVLVSGPRGSAKSTLARGLAQILANKEAEFVTLPLGASEDRLLGSLNLDLALQQQKAMFQPGLLSKAHGGVLYVDEVNLLADNLVDQLLDVVASGTNRVERDGVSHEHAAQFILIGTMNPDEGELRPQLQDRFGLMVSLDNNYSLDERVEIVKRREQYDANPVGFVVEYEQQQRQLRKDIIKAQKQLKSIICSDEIRMEIARRCQQAQVDGMRADIVWIKAATAHAAWQNQTYVLNHNLDAVEELVLAHRRQTNRSSSVPNSSDDDSDRNNDGGHSGSQSNQNDSSSSQAPQDVDWGKMTPQHQLTQSIDNLDFPQKNSDSKKEKAFSMTKTADVISKTKGHKLGGYQQHQFQATNKVNWFQTLLSAAKQKQWPPRELKYQRAKTGQSVLHLVLLDTSASTLGNSLFAKAKGVILALAHQAYLGREQIAIFAFGNDKVEQILPKVRAPKDIRHLLDALPAGGGTPLREALIQLKSWLEQFNRKSPQSVKHTYIITDGRTQADVSDIRLLGHTHLVDTEVSPVKRGRGKELAAALGADYVPLKA